MKILLLFFLFFSSAFANPWEHLEQGDEAAQEFLNQLDIKKRDAGSHPFYNGQTPPEANFTSSDLIGKSQRTAQGDLAGQMIMNSASARAQFKIDPRTDPLLIQGQKIMETPLTRIGGKGTHSVETVQDGNDTTHVCEEPGDPSLETCLHELKVTLKKTKIRKEWRGSFQVSKCSHAEKWGHYLPCMALREALYLARWGLSVGQDPSVLNITEVYKACINELAVNGRNCYECNAFLPNLPAKVSQIKEILFESHPYNSYALHMACDHFYVYKSGRDEYNYQPYFKVVYEEEAVEVLPDEWVSNCDRLEEKDDQGLCSYETKVCTQGRETRLIDGVPITRDCWQYAVTYACSIPTQDDCGPLRARGCAQIHSICKQYVGNSCVVYSQTYQCKGNKQTRFQIVGGKTPFCLDGNCRDQSYEANDEMMSSLAQLSLLKEMEGKFEGGIVFKGEDKRCSKWIFKFIDCCGSGKGWGKDIGFAKCKSQETELRDKRKAGLCHFVGTYCDKKVLGKCIKKKSSYCCFPNKLLKVFHEQGRPQIGLSWGEPKSPLCRGFTIEEIQKIDFSKLDLREVFEDLMKNFKPDKQQGMEQESRNRVDKVDFNQVYEDIMHKTQPTQTQNVGKRLEERLELLKKGLGK